MTPSQSISDGVSRLGLGLETRLETHFWESRSQSRRFQVSVSKVSGLEIEYCKEMVY